MLRRFNERNEARAPKGRQSLLVIDPVARWYDLNGLCEDSSSGLESTPVRRTLGELLAAKLSKEVSL